MSVWTSATYKLEICRALWAIAPPWLATVFPGGPTTYLNPDPRCTQVPRDATWEDVAYAVGWKSSQSVQAADFAEECAESFMPSGDGTRRYLVGVEALYAMVGSVTDGSMELKEYRDLETLNLQAKNCFRFVAPSTQCPHKEAVDAFMKHDHELMTRAEGIRDCANFLKKVKQACHKKEVTHVLSKEAGQVVRSRYYGVCHDGLCILRGSGEYANRTLVLTAQHMDHLVGSLLRIAAAMDYIATDYELPEMQVFKGRLLTHLLWTIERGVSARGENANIVVKALHKLRAMAQMRLQSNLIPETESTELAEYHHNGLQMVASIESYNDNIDGLPPAVLLDCLHMYKWMPPPDFDATRVPYQVENWHMNPRKCALDDDATEEMRKLWTYVVDERDLHTAIAIERMRGEIPAGFPETVTHVSRKSIKVWVKDGSLPYYQLGKDLVSQVKDKQTVSSSFDAEMSGRTTRMQSKFLMWYLEEGHRHDTVAALRGVKTGELAEDNYVRVAYKPEAHKPDSRLFYMAPPMRRILLGELEGNLAKVAASYPGCIMGKDSASKAKILADVMDPYHAPHGETPNVDHTMFIVTFDLSKFSPRSAGRVVKDYHEHWARVFGVKDIADLYEIGPDSKILHTTNGIVHAYKNHGADLEGFRGRMMTMFHADMLGAACRLARERGYTIGKATLATFIDDGACKIIAKGLGAEAVSNARCFIQCMSEVYASAGQEVNVDKTVLSELGGEMLAEQHHKGVKLPCGIRAAMRLYPDYENGCSTFTEEMDQLFAASQGAVKDGSLWFPAYHRYVKAVLRSLTIWVANSVRRISPADLALKLYTPKSFGGFSMQGLQSLVTTAVNNQTSEGLAILNRAGRAHTELKSRVAAVMSQSILEREPLALLREPTRIRTSAPVINEGRLSRKVLEWMRDAPNVNLPAIKAHGSRELIDHATEVATTLLNGNVVSVPVLELAWKATPLAYIEAVAGKFKRSGTIIDIVGWKTFFDIRMKNRADLERCLGHRC